jgi:hypothetical protein
LLNNHQRAPRHVESIRALLVERSECPVETVRTLYLPRLNGQPQGMRRDWENLFHLDCTGLIACLVENREMGNSGNGFFEQLQPLSR